MNTQPYRSTLELQKQAAYDDNFNVAQWEKGQFRDVDSMGGVITSLVKEHEDETSLRIVAYGWVPMKAEDEA